MKPGNYDKLLEKYFRGETNAAEEQALANSNANKEMLEALKEVHNETMDWGFDDFMKEASKAPVAQIQKRSYKSILAVAATIAIIATVALGMWLLSKNNDVDTNFTTAINQPTPIENNVKTTDTNVVSKGVRDEKYSSDENKNLIALQQPNRKKTYKIAAKARQPKVMPDSAPAYVMVNGQPITDMQEAEEIAGKSLALLSENLTAAVSDLKTISEFKINF